MDQIVSCFLALCSRGFLVFALYAFLPLPLASKPLLVPLSLSSPCSCPDVTLFLPALWQPVWGWLFSPIFLPYVTSIGSLSGEKRVQRYYKSLNCANSGVLFCRKTAIILFLRRNNALTMPPHVAAMPPTLPLATLHHGYNSRARRTAQPVRMPRRLAGWSVSL